MTSESSHQKQTRARIIEVAAELLTASSTGQISTREVCAAAGVKPPTLYHHFGDKDGLLHAVVADGFERYLARKRAVGTTGDVVTDFRRGWDMHVEFGVTHPALYNVMYGRPMARQDVPAAAVARTDLVATMRTLDDAGRLRLPVEVAADAVETAAVGVTLHLIRTDGTRDDPAAAIVRDAVIAAVIGPSRTYTDTPASPHLAATAAQVRDALPHGPVATLRASETALLRDWLDELATAAPTEGPERHRRPSPR
ncbi:TetR/AcrR family transcriptional regulator [Nonomuraea glycinis]|uniref:TetR/AcrR family transcriptional regulator n=1 Tax=Nonomuraea glycinis TaxID=2047744 RepID=UPI002E0DBC83|nr:TetR/AcrR family transcriptional regulator [Nonomuraea glycinis]